MSRTKRWRGGAGQEVSNCARCRRKGDLVIKFRLFAWGGSPNSQSNESRVLGALSDA